MDVVTDAVDVGIDAGLTDDVNVVIDNVDVVAWGATHVVIKTPPPLALVVLPIVEEWS